VDPATHAESRTPSAINGVQRPRIKGNAIAVTIAAPNAHLRRVARSGNDALRHAASGPIPIRNTSGAISGTNTASKYGGPTEILPRPSASRNSGYNVPSITVPSTAIKRILFASSIDSREIAAKAAPPPTAPARAA